MTDYKQAGDLVPDDLYIRPRQLCHQGTRDQIYRVIKTRPGNAATIVEVSVKSMKTGRRSVSNFFRTNRDSAKGTAKGRGICGAVTAVQPPCAAMRARLERAKWGHGPAG